MQVERKKSYPKSHFMRKLLEDKNFTSVLRSTGKNDMEVMRKMIGQHLIRMNESIGRLSRTIAESELEEVILRKQIEQRTGHSYGAHWDQIKDQITRNEVTKELEKSRRKLLKLVVKLATIKSNMESTQEEESVQRRKLVEAQAELHIQQVKCNRQKAKLQNAFDKTERVREFLCQMALIRSSNSGRVVDLLTQTFFPAPAKDDVDKRVAEMRTLSGELELELKTLQVDGQEYDIPPRFFDACDTMEDHICLLHGNLSQLFSACKRFTTAMNQLIEKSAKVRELILRMKKNAAKAKLLAADTQAVRHKAQARMIQATNQLKSLSATEIPRLLKLDALKTQHLESLERAIAAYERRQSMHLTSIEEIKLNDSQSSVMWS